jgi:hypothetical protein
VASAQLPGQGLLFLSRTLGVWESGNVRLVHYYFCSFGLVVIQVIDVSLAIMTKRRYFAFALSFSK